MTLVARIFLLVMVALLPSLGVQLYNELDARQVRSREGEHQALAMVHLIGDEQARVFEGAHQLLTSLGTISNWTRDPASCAALFNALRDAHRQFTLLASYGLDGRPICYSGTAEPPLNALGHTSFQTALHSGKFVVSGYEADSETGRPFIVVSQPFTDSDGKVAGVVAGRLSLDWLNHELAAKSLPANASVSLVDRYGTILARHPGAEAFVGKLIPNATYGYMLSGEGAQEAIGFDGITRIYAYGPLPGGPPGITVCIGLDKAKILQDVQVANRRGLLVIPIEALVALLVAGIGAQLFLERPVRRLLQAADRLRQGDLDARVLPREHRSELGRIGAAFDTMAEAVAAREHELERRVAERTQELRDAMAAQRTAEAALHQAQKMEAIGRLTGGIAHDFNNLLAAVIGNIEMARGRLTNNDAAAARLEAAQASAQRGARLTQHLLAFARRQTLRPEVVDVNQQVRSMLDVLQRLLRSDITVVADLAQDAWPVRVDPNQLEAAILNLAINARDAMPRGGKLSVETRNVTLLTDPSAENPAGDFVALSIRDTGMGIAPENLGKVFEPFFTTKEIGRGSGLGLSMVHGFAQQSAGSVTIQSTVGIGTAVTLFLPRTTALPAVAAGEPLKPMRGEGTVLLVDDHDDVRTVLSDMLRQAGYRVVAARDAADAMEKVDRQGKPDLLIVDLVLRGDTNGQQLARELRRQQPGLPVLFVTGYSEALIEDDLSGAIVLTKPFEFARLAEAMNAARRGAPGRTVGARVDG